MLPELGTLEDFDRLLKRAQGYGIELALTSRFTLPTIRMSKNIPSGFAAGPTARFNTPRTLPRNIRTSIRSISRATTGKAQRARDVFRF